MINLDPVLSGCCRVELMPPKGTEHNLDPLSKNCIRHHAETINQSFY